MLSTLFTNLREHTIAAKGVDFTEDLIPFDSIGELRTSENQLFLSSFQELLDFSDVIDFAAKKDSKGRTCKKGYPCGASCINAGYNCKKGIAGQAKTYAEFLSLQRKQPKKSVQKPLDKKNKTQDTGKNKATKKKQEVTEMATKTKSSDLKVPDTIVQGLSNNSKDLDRDGASYFTTDVSSIKGESSTGNVDLVQKLARQIIDNGGQMATPLILISKGLDYEIANDPNNKILAEAVREAKKIDPRIAEMASSFNVRNQEEADALLFQRKVAKLDLNDTPDMKDGKFFTVDVKNISGGKKPTNLSDDELEAIAQSQTKVGNMLPLVLRQTGLEQYEVVSGDAAITAGRRAKEINLRRNEMINAFIIPKAKK